jgi:RNA polymerase sigma-70 factor (ECF subfamily)
LVAGGSISGGTPTEVHNGQPWTTKESLLALGEGFEGVVAAAGTGAEWAWEALYRDLAPLVHGYLRSRGAREPEDLTGEVFLALARDLPSFTGNEGSFRSWVLTVTHHRLLDERRYHGRRPSDPVPEDVIQSRTATGNVEEDALRSLATSRIRQLVDALAGDQREVLMLRIVGGLTVNEVAGILHKSPGAVKALQRRGLAVIRRIMDEEVVPL